MRISGFASGMDIDQMVSDLMKAERIPMNKLTQQKQLLEWKRDDYRDLNKLLTDFRNLSFDMTLQRTYSQKQVTSSNTKVTAIASSTAANASYTISDVTVATAASNSTSGFVTSGQTLESSKGLWEQRNKFTSGDAMSNMWTSKTVTQNDITIATETNSIKLAKGAIDTTSINGNGEITVNIGGIDKVYTVTTNTPVADLTDSQVLLDENTGILTFKDNIPAGSTVKGFNYDHFAFEFSMTTYNQQGEAVDETFSLDGTASMEDVMSKINASKLGVTAFYDEQSNTMMMTKREAGTFKDASATAEIEFGGLFLTSVIGLNETNEQGGTAAQVTINGVTTSRNSNTFSVNGVTFTLNENMSGESAVISVNNDTDKTFDAIKNYVEKYNELITKINEKTSQAVYRDYNPLTNEERESLSEKQIEQWEEKAKSGLLKNDSILTSGIGQLRSNFYEPLSGATGAFNQLAQIGISTSANYRDGGKLVINEVKLREAIQQDSASVMELFTANGADSSSQGLARRLRESVGTTIQQIEARAGNSMRTNQQFTLGRELLNVEKRISTFEMRLQQKESRYWRQFTAMEKAINISNNQSMQLMSQFYNNG
ncbi:flagellar filament capping protein FliD [Bacillus tianshenii]|uniref:flagellar filament capping protein FliD n=1 Tax=Sutcliffiella tianshenii TaxID=1463404 RepID=UPI001CD56500|nr:flagellar filament capping protein FliD [Bacillus tianshenii]MCA1320523.1 flagellar filament capping protein FliD [Bacillus tianshenii]